MNNRSLIRLGIIGCGAVTESGHLPAYRQIDRIKINVLVDAVLPRAQRLAELHNIPHVEQEYQKISSEVDAVIIATPPHLHKEQVLFFLDRGIHVLCEKPLALSNLECQEIKTMAENSCARLAVGQVRRFFWYAQKIKELLDKDLLGDISSITADEGYSYSWPAYTPYAFHRDFSPGGVMFDLGIHLIDLFLWLIGPIGGEIYGDDAIGGIESNAETRLFFENGVQGHIQVSRTCERTNLLRIEGKSGWAQANIYNPSHLQIFYQGIRRKANHKSNRNLISAFTDQLLDFIKAIEGDSAPMTSVDEAIASMEVLERCYQKARSRLLPEKSPIPGVILWT